MTLKPKKKQVTPDQYDSPWKEAIEEYFQECMAFFFPEIHADIDWSAGYQFLDKELEKVVRQSIVTESRVDKLIQVQCKSGKTTWVLLHLEVQSQYEINFAKRMYRYHYRLFDRYDREIITAVIFGDEHPKWRPTQYKQEKWACELTFKFPSVKLMDYRHRLNELEQSSNPFAVVVSAHLYTQQTHQHMEQRYDLKWRLTRMLYERGYKKEKILSLYRYINWLMALPAELEQQLDDAIIEYEETQKMAYITSIERRWLDQGIGEGIEQGLQQGLQQGLHKGMQKGFVQKAYEDVIEVLKIRFGEIQRAVAESIRKIDDVAKLTKLHQKAVTVESVEQFKQLLESEIPPVTEVEDKPLELVREDIIEVLAIRFGELPQSLGKAVSQVKDLAKLKQLHKEAITIATVEDFFVVLQNGNLRNTL